MDPFEVSQIVSIKSSFFRCWSESHNSEVCLLNLLLPSCGLKWSAQTHFLQVIADGNQIPIKEQEALVPVFHASGAGGQLPLHHQELSWIITAVQLHSQSSHQRLCQSASVIAVSASPFGSNCDVVEEFCFRQTLAVISICSLIYTSASVVLILQHQKLLNTQLKENKWKTLVFLAARLLFSPPLRTKTTLVCSHYHLKALFHPHVSIAVPYWVKVFLKQIYVWIRGA